MTIRDCPDCQGKGRLWRPPGLRVVMTQQDYPAVSSTAVSSHCEMLPEYETCPLCKGQGKGRVEALENER